MSSQFFQRVANYVANEVIVKGLANSRTFQRFAVRADKQFKDVHEKGTENITKTVEEFVSKAGGEGTATSASASAAAGGTAKAAAGSSGLQPPQRPLRGIPGFAVAFFKEIRKDVTGS
mmetsp:Transcript_23948/g.56579  ORF Transcript_23948/g.56579 Transcript_23948/m.56579 type:complete len:118 (+) Transcript_23948:98-451(+)